jgi:hypothetical protein
MIVMVEVLQAIGVFVGGSVLFLLGLVLLLGALFGGLPALFGESRNGD